MQKTSDIIWQDTQHQVLFEILDMMNEPTVDARVYTMLLEYTESHFSLEERYMWELGYPDRERHIQAHDRFRQEVAQLVEGDEPDALLREPIATFLTEWLKRHVFGVDKELEAFLLECNVR